MRRAPYVCVVLSALVWSFAGADEAEGLTCLGKVVDAEGKPVGGAKVWVYRLTYVDGVLDVRLAGRAETGEDGAFSATLPRKDDLKSETGALGVILAGKEGHGFGWCNVFGDDYSGIDIQLGKPATLDGIVVDQAGKPVQDARVGAYLLAGGQPQRFAWGMGELSQLIDKTDADGRFAFENVPADARAEFVLQASGFASRFTGRTEGPPQMQFAPGQKDIRIALEPEARIEGKVIVKETGEAVAGAPVRVRKSNDMPVLDSPRTRSADDWTFVICALDADAFKLMLDGSWSTQHNWAAEALGVTTEVGRTATGVVLELVPGLTLAGRVVAPDGTPLEGAHIEFRRGTSPQIAARVRTDAGGIYEIKGLGAVETGVLTASASGYGMKRLEINMEDAEEGALKTDDIELALANMSISGIVVDEDDKPVANAMISTGGQGQTSSKTDAQGKFAISGVCKGAVHLAAVLVADSSYGGVQAEAGATDVKIVLDQKLGLAAIEPPEPPSLVEKALPALDALGVAADTTGKCVLVCFWSAEERPSRRCLRMLAERAVDIDEKGVAAVAVHAFPMDDKALAEWKERFKITFEMVALGESAKQARLAWGVQSLPWLILADAQHVVTAEGFQIEEFDEKLERILQK